MAESSRKIGVNMFSASGEKQRVVIEMPVLLRQTEVMKGNHSTKCVPTNVHYQKEKNPISASESYYRSEFSSRQLGQLDIDSANTK
jgi:hypothetical protein